MRRILVVDDSPMMRALYRQMLGRRRDCSLSFAVDGAAALAQIAVEEPHLIFLDINMPTMNGLEVLMRLRASGVLDRVRVVIVSTEGSAGDVERGMNEGASAYVPKPFQPNILGATVDRLVPPRTETPTIPCPASEKGRAGEGLSS